MLEKFLLLIEELLDFLTLNETDFIDPYGSVVVGSDNKTHKNAQDYVIIGNQPISLIAKVGLAQAVENKVEDCDHPVYFKDHQSHDNTTQV